MEPVKQTPRQNYCITQQKATPVSRKSHHSKAAVSSSPDLASTQNAPSRVVKRSDILHFALPAQ